MSLQFNNYICEFQPQQKRIQMPQHTTLCTCMTIWPNAIQCLGSDAMSLGIKSVATMYETHKQEFKTGKGESETQAGYWRLTMYE